MLHARPDDRWIRGNHFGKGETDMGSGWKKLRRGTRRLYTIAYAGLVGARTGANSIVMRGAVLNREYGGDIDIGPGTVVHRGAMLIPLGGHIRLGYRCRVNPY